MGNPLVAQTQDSTKAYSGVPLLEDAIGLKDAIESGDWASVAMGAVGTALDALTAVMDPFGAIFAAGVGWLIEHVGPLKEALNALTGNADEIAAQSQTWNNIAKELEDVSTELTNAVKADLVGWQGPAADNYRKRAEDTSGLLAAAQKGCEGAGSGVKTAGEVVGAVRTLVRDIIAELVGHLISWALQVVFTLGIGLTWVVPQVIAAVAKTASKIASLTTKLVKALKALVPLLKKAGTLFEDAAKGLKNIKGGKVGPPGKPGKIDGNPKSPDVKDGKGGKDGDSTTTSGDHSGGTGDKTPGDPPGGGGKDGGKDGGGGKDGSTSTSGDHSGGNGNKAPSDPPPAKKDPGKDGDTGGGGKDTWECKTDPVDIARGNVVIDQLDLELPSPLVLERLHVSSYRAGRWFGPSWVSTVDQRLAVGRERVRCFAADGTTLVYPLAEPGAPVLPVDGPRRPLTRHADGSYTQSDPLRGRELRFAALPGRGSAELVLRSVTDADGARVEFDYDALGAPLALRHSAGYRVELETEGGRVTAVHVTDPAGQARVLVRRFGYDELGRLTQEFNASGRPQVYDYDAAGRVTGWQDRNGTWFRYVYDTSGRCVRTIGDRGFYDAEFAYDTQRRVTTFTDSLGHAGEYHFNEANQLVREVGPLGGVTTSEWDRDDRLLSRTDPLGRTTSFAYDERGALRSVTRPDGSLLRVTQDAAGLTIETTADDGVVLSRFYPRDELPDPFTETLGIAKPLTSEQAAWTRGDEEPPPVDRDVFGRPRSVLNRSGQPVVLGWTPDGGERLRVRPSGVRESRGYDAEGNEVEHVNGAGLAERTEYGPFDLVTATIDASGARTTYSYDTELRPSTVTNPLGQSWTYRYDPAGRLVEETDFDGRTLRFGYDAAGRLVRSANGAGEQTEYVHDVLGNVVERRSPAGTTRFAYDAVGRMTAAVVGDVELRVTYDGEGTVLGESVDGRTLTHVHEADGTVRRRTPSGVDSVWTFDAAGRPASLVVAGHTVRFEHDAGGREVARTVEGGVALTQVFDVDDNLVGQSVQAAGAPPRHRRFSYRPDGLLAGIDDDVAGPTRLVLDATGRVTEVHGATGSQAYRYDPAGNVVETREPGQVPSAGTRRYANNRLVSAGAVAFDHDPQGRVIARNEGGRTWRYRWDSQDRLLSVTTPEGDQWWYRYDPIGRRIGKQRVVTSATGARVVAESYEFTWSGALLVEQVHVDAAQTRRVTVWEYHPGDDRPVVQVERAATLQDRFFAIVTDLVGRPTELLDAAGTPVWRGNASLWGRETGPAATPLRFPGQYADAESGLHYNVFRYYDPSTGRYLSQDPLGLGPAPNPAAYVDNPLAERDLLGLACKKGGGKNKTNDQPGGGDNAGNIPRGGGNKGKGKNDETQASGSGGAGKSDTHSFGKQDGTEVQVDSHQGKHQAGNQSFGMKYTGGSGTKFPDNVNDKWHKDYFSKEVAKYSNDPAYAKHGTEGKNPGSIDQNVNAKKSDLDAHQERVDELESELNAKKAAYKNASAEDKPAVMEEGKKLNQQFKDAKADRDKAEADYNDAKAERESYDGNRKSVQYDKDAKDDGVQYDMTSYWKPDGHGGGNWVTTYHCNPAVPKGGSVEKDWWQPHGKGIAKEFGL
ncbi:RHS repeat-associated core domain-containing protein [Amycolatopsis sp. cmx-4-83]|uniref:RHS repeat-associated core domain-containing protein n=1 Tax=Amycolatopsis sp. cmx-4-83 TaxID=2790940 RepID=UPI00397B7C5F